jgi:hypothetical protein
MTISLVEVPLGEEIKVYEDSFYSGVTISIIIDFKMIGEVLCLPEKVLTTLSIMTISITILSILAINIVMLNVYAECRYAECRYIECCYAECRYAACCYAEWRYSECRGVILTSYFVIKISG